MPALRHSDVKLFAFNTRVHDKTSRVPQYMLNLDSPITIRNHVRTDFKPNGGTALADSVRKVVNDTQPDLLIVFSDEISWADYGRSYVFENLGTDVIAINPYPQSMSTVFSPNESVVKLSSLDAKIFYYIPMLANYSRFKEWMIDWAFDIRV